MSILIESTDTGFCAFVTGDRSISGEGPTRDEAVAALQAEIRARAVPGRPAADVAPLAVTDLAGIWADDPTVSELIDEIYRLRDEDQQRIVEAIDGRF